MITTQIIAQIKAWNAKFLTSTCSIERRVATTGSMGEPKQDEWVTVSSSTACRILPIGITAVASASGLVGEQEALTDSYRAILPAGTDLDVDYRITVGSLVYNVTRLLTARTDETDVQALVTRQR